MAAPTQPAPQHRKPAYQQEIQQMMFVSGEVQEPLEETTLLVEEIVRTQMVETIVQAVAQCSKRGSRFLSPEDLIFLIRHDRAKVNRLRTFLSWKDVRKNVKDNKEGGAPVEEELIEDQEKALRVRRMKVKFGWDPLTMYSNILDDDLPGTIAPDGDNEAVDDAAAQGVDEEELQAYEDQVARLKLADEITRTMTKDEYIYYSECRQASFTYKKVKRFRDWCDLHLYYDAKVNSDVMDILGFLGYEVVSRITETALEVKREWDEQERDADAAGMSSSASLSTLMDVTHVSLFEKPRDGRAPLEPAHIHEAFRRLQALPNETTIFRGSVPRSRLQLI